MDGATDRVTVASDEVPAEFVASIVYWVDVKTEVGVPEITQVLGFMVKYDGNAVVPPFIEHPVIDAPLVVRVDGVIDIELPTVPAVPAEDP